MLDFFQKSPLIKKNFLKNRMLKKYILFTILLIFLFFEFKSFERFSFSQKETKKQAILFLGIDSLQKNLFTKNNIFKFIYV